MKRRDMPHEIAPGAFVMKQAMRRGLFVTGTDTGVGKTQVTAALARLLVERQLMVRPRKPVESGCRSHRFLTDCDTSAIPGSRREGNRLLPNDALELQTAALSKEVLERICPYTFETALSPERAAALAGISLTLDELRSACLDGVANSDFLLVEGAGGFYSPLATHVLNADLTEALSLPVLLVAADRLGAINHTLLAVEAIKTRGLTLAGVVLNRIERHRDPLMDNVEDLSNWLGQTVIVTEHFTSAEGSPGWMQLCPSLVTLADGLAADTR
ncbi:dethiobiotin synthase [Methylobacter sp.]|uniref:dethiobiotin synthase n=1 Tax=Methylobacter sp. TaxID=2051955 RepID=UPI002488749F|nr:dethiobiotin synthase [Methylobacter sp.]MDI1276960.1 dethiobiotin synthase [Methylobacter sp.]MDI1357578.1 dethiobiotin synthase [Methylobacter sp.]